MAASSNFIFDGKKSKLERCTLGASLPDPYWCDQYNHGEGKEIVWWLDFRAAASEHKGEIIAPTIDIDGLPVTLSSWKQLARTSVQWKKPINPATDERYGLTYVFDHQLITACTVEFRSRRRNRFKVLVEGRDARRKRFSIEAMIPFQGVRVGATTNETASQIESRLGEILDLAELKAGPLQADGANYDSGVGMASMSFEPVL